MQINPITLPLLTLTGIGVLIFCLFFFSKMVQNPRLGIYAVILAAPFTGTIGGNAILRRLTISEVMGVALFAAWFLNQIYARKSQNPRFSSFYPVAWAVVLVPVVSMIVNIVDHTNPFAGFVQLGILIYLLIFYALFEKLIWSEDDIRGVINSWIAAVAIVAFLGVWAIASKFWNLPVLINLVEDKYGLRVSGTFRSTGQLGVYMLTSFWVVMGTYFIPNISKKYKLSLLLLMIGIVIVSLGASRRSAFAGFLAGGGVYTLINIKDMKRFLIWCGIALCLIVVFVSVLNFNERFAGYFYNRISVLHPDNIMDKPTIHEQTRSLVAVLKDKPIMGIGLGGFQFSKYDTTNSEIHSAPGQMLVECGIIGFIVYLFVIGLIWKFAYDNAFKLKDPLWTQFNRVMFAGLFAIYTAALYNRHLRERSFWVYVGIVICINRALKWKAAGKAAEEAQEAPALGFEPTGAQVEVPVLATSQIRAR